jgi:CRP-like cAMP-binding protein
MHNFLLECLPDDAGDRLLPHCERVTLARGDHVVVPGEPIRHVYFPAGCLLSRMTTMRNGATVECASIGREGMSGIPVLLDAAQTTIPVFCLVPGAAVRVRAEVVKEFYESDARVRQLFNRYCHTVVVSVSYSAACNRIHGLDERLCRWLLMSSDGVGSEELALTQESLALVLGVRRAGVTEAAGELRGAGLITYRRRRIRVLDREGLAARSCECYGQAQSEYERLFAQSVG